MGNLLSRPKQPRERLFELEHRASVLESQLANLRRARWFSLRPLFFGAAVGVAWAVAEFSADGIYGALIGAAVAMLSLWLVERAIRGWRIRRTESALRRCRAALCTVVEELRQDRAFSETRALLERYESAECRASFFSRIQKKKRDAMERLTDYVLGNDPAALSALICRRCGVHNGMVDPGNSDFPYFYCYDCGARNARDGSASPSAPLPARTAAGGRGAWPGAVPSTVATSEPSVASSTSSASRRSRAAETR